MSLFKKKVSATSLGFGFASVNLRKISVFWYRISSKILLPFIFCTRVWSSLATNCCQNITLAAWATGWLGFIVVTSQLCRRHPAGALHQWRRGLVFQFNRLRRLHASGSCVSSSEKLMNFMHFHNSYTQNHDHHILLIMTGNAHKESCHKLSLCFSGRKDWNTIKTDGSGQMVVAYTITEINYLPVSLFWDVVLPLSYLYLWYLVLWLRYLSCFRHSDKSGYGFPKIIYLILVASIRSSYFQTNVLSKFSFTHC